TSLSRRIRQLTILHPPTALKRHHRMELARPARMENKSHEEFHSRNSFLHPDTGIWSLCLSRIHAAAGADAGNRESNVAAARSRAACYRVPTATRNGAKCSRTGSAS